MKKLVIGILLVFVTLSLAGCSSLKVDNSSDQVKPQIIYYSEVSGTIWDASTSPYTRLQGATVTIGTYPSVTTDVNGRYSGITVAEGIYTVTVSKTGYKTNTFSQPIYGPVCDVSAILKK